MHWLNTIRQHLHQHPELSGHEIATSTYLKAKLSSFRPSYLIENIGSYSFIAVWDTGISGPSTLLRADMDALPILEANKNLSYASTNKGVSHKCGHDGHSTVLVGVAERLQEMNLIGKIFLLFQSAEETGEGAAAIVQSEEFSKLNIDHAFALHNIPGSPLGKILCKDGVFCPSSTGLRVFLKGRSSHASEPEKGLAPTSVIKDLLNTITDLNQQYSPESFCTLTHIEMGEKTFGVQPGEAEILITIRSFNVNGYQPLLDNLLHELKILCCQHSIALETSLSESFEATLNSKLGYELIKSTAQSLHYEFEEMDKSNPWSEDFGLILNSAKSGAMFGLGSGTDTPNLHDPEYDFPDELIPFGVKFFCELINSTNKKP